MAADSALLYLHAPLAEWLKSFAESRLGQLRQTLETHGFQVQDGACAWARHQDCGALRTSRALDIRDPQTRTLHQLRLDLVSHRRSGTARAAALHELRLTLQQESAVLRAEPAALVRSVATLRAPAMNSEQNATAEQSLVDALTEMAGRLREAVEP